MIVLFNHSYLFIVLDTSDLVFIPFNYPHPFLFTLWGSNKQFLPLIVLFHYCYSLNYIGTHTFPHLIIIIIHCCYSSTVIGINNLFFSPPVSSFIAITCSLVSESITCLSIFLPYHRQPPLLLLLHHYRGQLLFFLSSQKPMHQCTTPTHHSPLTTY